MTDHQLVHEILYGNSQKAFELLVEKYQRLVVMTCRGFLSNYADAEDLAQEVFIEVFQSIHRFRNESKLSTWLYRIAVNKSLNFVRRQKRSKIFESLDRLFSDNTNGSNHYGLQNASNGTPDGQIQIAEDRKALKQAINSLPDNQRIAFILNKYMDLTYKEVAEVMNITLPAVESLLFRAKTNLQKKILGKRNME